ncbi:MAG: helix-turn-helix transcriptional regulator [Clostridiales bacterium]|nr:helix-turn-helix transcriptional regulator [Clostridiales bacterium]
MSITTAVRERLTTLCKKRGLTIHALAHISGVHPSTVKGIVNGANQAPGIVTLKKLCDGLDISICEFFDAEVFRNLEREIE